MSGKNFGAGNIDHTLENIFWKSAGTGPETMYFDEAFDRLWVDPEPTTALAAESSGPWTVCTDGGSWWNTGWGRRTKLTFGNGAQTENLVGFPVLVKLDATRIDYAKTQNQGQDLRFVDADDATVLDHQIELWDEAGTSYVWVRVPQIDGSSTTDHIFMYYDNAFAADGQNPGGVWSTGYEAVYHLHADVNDSTPNGYNGTNNGTLNATGLIADAQEFTGVNETILFSTLTWAPTTFSVDFWLYPRSTNNVNQSVGAVGAWGRFDFHTNSIAAILVGTDLA